MTLLINIYLDLYIYISIYLYLLVTNFKNHSRLKQNWCFSLPFLFLFRFHLLSNINCNQMIISRKWLITRFFALDGSFRMKILMRSQYFKNSHHAIYLICFSSHIWNSSDNELIMISKVNIVRWIIIQDPNYDPSEYYKMSFRWVDELK
jgi:hypothetical protein